MLFGDLHRVSKKPDTSIMSPKIEQYQ